MAKKRKHFEHKTINYSPEDLAKIEESVEQVKANHPEFSDRKARIWEIIYRYRGEAGLSESAVDYLVACLMYIEKTETMAL